MATIDTAYLTELRDATRGMVHVFGWQAAKTKTGGTKAVGTGPDAGKRPKYGKAAVAALAGGSKKKPLTKESLKKIDPAKGAKAADPKPADGAADAPAKPAVPPAEVQASAPAPTGETKAKQTKAGVRLNLHPYKPPRPMAPGDLAVAPAASAPKAPPPTPAETKALDAYHAADTKKYGPRTAGLLRGAAEAVRGLFTLGGLTIGTAAGGVLGGIVGGPLGMALGTALGGGLGGLAGTRVPLPGALARHEQNRFGPVAARRAMAAVPAAIPPSGNAVFTPGARARAKSRAKLRLLGSRVAGGLAAAPALAVGAAAPIAGVVGGTIAGGPLGGALGAVGGMAVLARGQLAADRAYDGAKAQVAGRLATSAAAKRVASRTPAERYQAEANKDHRKYRKKLGLHSERFSEELPPNAVAMLKVRIMLAARKAGVKLPAIPDEVVAAALKLASHDAAATATASTMSECVRVAGRIERANRKR